MMRSARTTSFPRGLRLNDERGFALIVAVFAMVVIGAVIAGSFFAARLEQQSGRSVLFASQAGEAAEAGLSDAMAVMPVAELEVLPPGGAPLELGTLAVGPGLSASRQVFRLAGNLFLVRAQGQRLDADGRILAIRTVGILAHLFQGPARLVRLAQRGWVQL